MASAHVLSNSRKEHLEAGKKRLEEFRKKKAADKAKKDISTGQLSSSDAGQNEKQSSESLRVGITDSDGAGTSSGFGGILIETSGVATDNDVKKIEPVQKNGISSSNDRPADSLESANNYVLNSAVPLKTDLENEDVLRSAGSVNVNYAPHDKENYDFSTYNKASERIVYDTTTDQSMTLHPPSTRAIDGTSGPSSYYGLNEAVSNSSGSNLKDISFMNRVNSDSLVTSVSPVTLRSFLKEEKSGYSNQLASGLTCSTYEESIHHIGSITESPAQVWQNKSIAESNNPMIPDMWESKYNISAGNMDSKNNSSMWLPESRYISFGLDAKSSSNHLVLSPALSGTNSKTSRPSFLDSIKVPRVSSTSTPLVVAEKADSFSSRVRPVDSLSLALPNSANSSVVTGNGGDMLRNGVIEHIVESKNDFYSRKHDEDFAALEQHIEDLTQEKFSLQRALEAARVLSESLAAENSALTDTYNQQGSIVNQLKSDMEKLREEIKVQLVELESVKTEYTNAQLECNAADERAKLLASEVIGLEEKALRLRSSELKLERQLENSQAEISSLKKKISSLVKERQDLQATIDALQEEKKLLQSKLRKASASGKFVDTSKDLANKNDVSTTTEDLDIDVSYSVSREDTESTTEASHLGRNTTATLVGEASSFLLLHDHRQFDLEALCLTIPPDQMRMIQNINTLISELALEKEELMQALSAQLSESSKVKELNKELIRKLEVQTQRLELLTAQTMATDNIPARQPDSHMMHENTAYADEGDEVVERVLGWIMKLFPGGPSRRRTSKLL